MVGQTAQAQCMDHWTGTWNTSEGPIRLIQDGRDVYGDLGLDGIIRARTEDECGHWQRGAITRGNRRNYFEIRNGSDDQQRFTGYFSELTDEFLPQWNVAQGTRWRGNRTDTFPPPIVNFGPTDIRSVDSVALPAIRGWLTLNDVRADKAADAQGRRDDYEAAQQAAQNAQRNKLETLKRTEMAESEGMHHFFAGRWSSTYGELRLRQVGRMVFGDYANIGMIRGWTSPNGRLLRAEFERNDGAKGYVEFRATGYNAKRFYGVWNYESQGLPSNARRQGALWRATKTSANPGRIISKAGDIELWTYRSTRSRSVDRWMQFDGEPDFKNYDLATGPVINQDKLRSLKKAQDHVNAVSAKNPQDVKHLLNGMGYDLIAPGIIEHGGLGDDALRAYVATNGQNVVVAFRGTKVEGQPGATFIRNGILTDGNVGLPPLSFLSQNAKDRLPANQKDARAHRGFQTAYNHLRPRIREALRSDKAKGKPVFIIGHSLGGALGSLLSLDIALNQPERFASVDAYLSGAPRVGNAAYAKLYEDRVPNTLQLMFENDVVPLIPKLGVTNEYNDTVRRYVHHSPLLILDKNGEPVSPNDFPVRRKWRTIATVHKNANYRSRTRDFVANHLNDPEFRNNLDAWTRKARRIEIERTRIID
ncbi:MAG: lipase family protein [Pseudomonadota bacterium]